MISVARHSASARGSAVDHCAQVPLELCHGRCVCFTFTNRFDEQGVQPGGVPVVKLLAWGLCGYGVRSCAHVPSTGVATEAIHESR